MKRARKERQEKAEGGKRSRQKLPVSLVQKKRRTIERHINEFTLRVLASW